MTQIGNLIVSWGMLFLIAVAVMVLWNLAELLWALTCKAYMKSIDYLTIAIVGGMAFIVGLAWDLLRLLYGTIAPPIIELTTSSLTRAQETLKLWQLYWKYGRAEFPSFRSFCRYMQGEGDDREQQDQTNEKKQERRTPPPEQPVNKYKDALQLLGFSESDSLTCATLKQRHRELISRVHPDKGCPTPVLAQQINDAVKIIKQKRGWK